MKYLSSSIRNLLTGIALISLLLVGALALNPSPAYAASENAKQIACEAAGGTYRSSGCSSDSGEASIDSTVSTVINLLSAVVGIVAVVMIIVGGLKYITSNGDANNIKTAKSTILYAIIGLIIVALAQVIVQFVLNETT